MATEHFTVIALPHSVAADAGSADSGFHVSLFVAPELTPDRGEAKLGSFTHFPHWAAVLRGDAEITLRDQAGDIEATAKLDVVDPDVWDAVFPPDTPVRAPGAPDWSDRYWRTFPAAELHDGAKLFHAMAMFSDPVSPPAPSVHPLGKLMGRLGVGTGSTHGDVRYDESRFTEQFDELLGEWPRRERRPLDQIEEQISGIDDPLARLATQLHRARRFYERTEAQVAYQERPDEGATTPRPPRPEPDFHERCTLSQDHPSLLRTLGLVIDLVVADPERLRSSAWLAATIVPGGDLKAGRSPRTRCEVSGDDLLTVPSGDDWFGGRLRIGDVNSYAVLDVDPDGSALKLERFLWTLPRLLSIEANGDAVHAAPTALRTLGFTVVRRQRAIVTQQRMERQEQLRSSLGGRRPPALHTEDVTQGLRVEVWDDTAKEWFSLHLRRITAEALGHGKIVTDLLEEGFIEGATATETPEVEDSPVHVHESIFGWEGWSLSAPRPGKRVRHENGDEIVEDQDADPDPVTPLVVTNRVENGTLPRLRYGRSYAFRAWGVDLAGNSRSHTLGPPTPPPPSVVSEVTAASASLQVAAAPPPGLVPLLRGETAAVVIERNLSRAETTHPPVVAEAVRILSDPALDRAVVSRLRARRGEAATARISPVARTDRASLVSRRFADSVTDEQQPFVAATSVVDPTMLAHAIDPELDLSVVVAALSTITPLRPFLRWNPVEPPAVVPRHAYTAGESLRQLVVRSGVTQDLETLEITVTDPAAYATGLEELGYRETSERHIAPPKTSQSESELHAAFDDAIGSTDPADHARLLAVALRESGTLFDMDVVRLDDPTQRDPQPGISLAHDPDVPPSELAKRTLPLTPGEAPVPGQYVIHDTDQLVLPYLPDVIGRGISLVFPEAGRDRQFSFPFGTEGFTARYQGDWPERLPFRLMLGGSDVLDGRLEGTLLSLGLPAGDVQRFRLSSSLDRDDIDLLGPWRMLPTVIREDEDVAEAAADGWLWALTPFDDVTLVHAVPRPLEAPRPTLMHAVRMSEGTTEVVLYGAVDVHGPSTEQLTAEAAWVDPIDDLSLPAPEDRASNGIAFTTPIRTDEDLAVLSVVPEDIQITVPGAGPVWVHRAVQHLGDTRHHTIRYRFRASTRFREYFDAEALTPGGPLDPADPESPVDDGQSVVGPVVELSVPSSARPAAPIVHSVIPLFRWDEGTEPEQPVAYRRRRRAGVRIYLERPWYSSGEGELLGVLVAPEGNDVELDKLVSQWGSDPVWLSAPVQNRGMFVELDDFLRAAGFDDRPGDALPVVPHATLPLTAWPGSPMVTVLGYRPEYSVERGMWYVDVAIDPGSTFWPFVRLAVARYQPDSFPGCHLSAPVRCDFVQLTPERTTSVSRTDIRHVRVVVSGPVGVRQTTTSGPPVFPTTVDALAANVGAHRKVVARLQRRDPQVPTDLGWETVAATELELRGHGRTTFEAAWVGSLASPVDLPLRRPGENKKWRVTVEEWERLPGDPANLGGAVTVAPPPVWEQRLVYADELAL